MKEKENLETIRQFLKDHPRWMLSGKDMLFRVPENEKASLTTLDAVADISKMTAAVIESGQLCIALTHGYMVHIWTDDQLSLDHDPHNPLHSKKQS